MKNILYFQFVRLIGALFCMALSASAWSLPWVNFPAAVELEPAHFLEKEAVNFSGVWEGECGNKPVVDLEIRHDAEKVTMKYGFMQEKYIIGDLKSENNANAQHSSASNSSLSWNEAKDTLVFINSQQFINADHQLFVFLSKVSMFRQADNLILTGEYYQGSNDSEGISRDSLICRYQLKSSKLTFNLSLLNS